MLEDEKVKSAKLAIERNEQKDKFTPMMRQYIETKANYTDCILCYRLGDFYEMFFEDAIITSRELELTLTGKDCGQEERAPMCGIPHHAINSYIPKLVEKGYKVAICEQLEDPKMTKGLVKRDVVKVITPGTIVDGNILEEKKNNYIMSIYKEGMFFGIAVCDISTGDFYATEIKEDNNFAKLLDEMSRYNPSEVLVNKMMTESKIELKKIQQRFDCFITEEEEKNNIENEEVSDRAGVGNESYIISSENKKYWNSKGNGAFTNDSNSIKNKFEVLDKNNNYVDIEKKMFAICAINGLMNYVESTQKEFPQNLSTIIFYEPTKYMSLDISARRNLEITEKMRDKSKKGTLLWVLDKTSTSMGGRLIRRWLSDPLVDINDINVRLFAVKELKDSRILRDDITDALKNVYDMERLAGKISYGTANARDLISLKNSVAQLPKLKQALSRTESDLLKNMFQSLDTLDDLYELVDKAIEDDPPITLKDGGVIKKGYNDDVDRLRDITTNGKQFLINIEAEEREKTGIKNLKIGYNKVFGYYIEISKSFVKLAPKDRYIRKQTLTNGERFITEELKKLENEIIGAQEKIVNLEYTEFVKIRNQIEENAKRLQISASIVSKIDVLCSFARVAEDYNYCMPEVNDSDVIDIKDGRHPVIEKILPAGDFIQNDAYLDSNENRLDIITGPNMAGKSTYMRQVALITLMAQVGSFVPASYAKIGVVDKIFTRVGASDDLAMGESTFMVEMMEVASILKNATSKSLVILDEIGRGTSTYDGLSIAWAVAEQISKIKAKTLFATHYHELVDLENKIEGTKNYHIAVKEHGEDVIFLRKIVEGGTDESYGVHVAKLAGVPKDVTRRANQILRTLERKSILRNEKLSRTEQQEEQGQISMYNYKLAEIAHELDAIDLNIMTPMDAMNVLAKLKEKMM
ncbi:MAG: DNA mismatch repair protein MutS [Clostridia bacterium]|nr:DNA mismatch repair protein MutS [Clostridia bacterium]